MTLAEDAIKSALTRRRARSVLIKDEKAFNALHTELQSAMSNAWSTAMREGIAGALDRLRDLGPGAFTREDGASIMRALEASVCEEAIRAAMREPVVNLSDALFRVGAGEVGKSTGVAIAFGRPDLDALDVLKTGNLYWVGNSWNVRTQNTIATILEDYFTDGMTRDGLTQRFAEVFLGGGSQIGAATIGRCWPITPRPKPARSGGSRGMSALVLPVSRSAPKWMRIHPKFAAK